jgi:uncharacterized protein HemY
MLHELERAAELEPNRESYTLLAKAYDSQGMTNEAAEVIKKINKAALPAGKPKRVLRPKRVVI